MCRCLRSDGGSSGVYLAVVDHIERITLSSELAVELKVDGALLADDDTSDSELGGINGIVLGILEIGGCSELDIQTTYGILQRIGDGNYCCAGCYDAIGSEEGVATGGCLTKDRGIVCAGPLTSVEDSLGILLRCECADERLCGGVNTAVGTIVELCGEAELVDIDVQTVEVVLRGDSLESLVGFVPSDDSCAVGQTEVAGEVLAGIGKSGYCACGNCSTSFDSIEGCVNIICRTGGEQELIYLIYEGEDVGGGTSLHLLDHRIETIERGVVGGIGPIGIEDAVEICDDSIAGSTCSLTISNILYHRHGGE